MGCRRADRKGIALERASQAQGCCQPRAHMREGATAGTNLGSTSNSLRPSPSPAENMEAGLGLGTAY
jgi:hypothetical protein